MNDLQNGHEILTYSGIYFDPIAPDPSLIRIEDIAHALSNTARFNGHTHTFYSVAEHCCWVSDWVPVEHRLTALMHDATEAYISDITRPIKPALIGYKEIEERLWQAIAARFNLPQELPECVHHADRILLATERRDLMNEQILPWPRIEGIAPIPTVIKPMRQTTAKAVFLGLFDQYSKARSRAVGGAA